MSDDKCYVTMRCRECPKYNCELVPIGTYIPEDSLKGCTRQIDEETYAKYKHLKEEVYPFCRTQEDKLRCLDRIDMIEKTILHSPIGRLLDSKGKALSSKRLDKFIQEYNESISRQK